MNDPETKDEVNVDTIEHIQAALQKARRLRAPDTSPTLPAPVPVSAPAHDGELWSRLCLLKPDFAHLAKHRVVAADHSDPAYSAFGMLRTKVLQDLRQNNWTSVAITSPTAGCGKTVVSLNLAFSLAHQKDCRTLLVDFDLRRPQIGKILGTAGAPSMESFLRGRIGIEEAFVRYGDNIAIGVNSRPVEFSAELLQSPETAKILKRMKEELKPDIVLFDLPPMLSCDDVMAFLPNIDCAMLVVAAEASTFNEAEYCERNLSERTNMLGLVLNKCRYTPEKYGY